MGMGGKAQREIPRAIANCQPFRNSTGSMRGTRGSTRDLGWLSSHRDHAKIKELLSRASYVVWSYDTPIGCVTEDETGNITKVYFDDSHSTTTSHHQSLLRMGFSDFKTIGEGPWTRNNRPRRARRMPFTRAPQPSPAPAPLDDQRTPTMAQMLDPRYGDPDWTPWLDGLRQSNLPHGAEERDEFRIAESGGRWVL